MVQVSRRYVSPEVRDRMYDILIKAVKNATYKQTIVNFLTDLLSPTERIMLAKRLAIAYLLMKKTYTYRDISQMLKVSLGTVQKVSAVLDTEGNGYKAIIKSLSQEEKVEEFMGKFETALDGALEMMTKVHGDYGSRLPDPNRIGRKKIKAF